MKLQVRLSASSVDMAIWDACAKAAEIPLFRFIQKTLGTAEEIKPVPVYAGGGYYYPEDDTRRLRQEMEGFLATGFTHAKIKVAAKTIADDAARIEVALDVLGAGSRLAVDAIYGYTHEEVMRAASEFERFGLWWFEDICDPLDFETIAAATAAYKPPIAAGEAQFSVPDARNLIKYSQLRANHDILLFDIAHCYGLPEYLGIIKMAEGLGWGRRSFYPHGGHLFTLHVVAALGLGGAELNPHNFQPFGGLTDDAVIDNGYALPPELPGIGFEGRKDLIRVFHHLVRDNR